MVCRFSLKGNIKKNRWVLKIGSIGSGPTGVCSVLSQRGNVARERVDTFHEAYLDVKVLFSLSTALRGQPAGAPYR